MYRNHHNHTRPVATESTAAPARNETQQNYQGYDQYEQYEQYDPAPQYETQPPANAPRQGNAQRPASRSEPEGGKSPLLDKYPEYFSLKVHGSRAALNFCPDVTRKNFLTVSLEGAEMLNPATRVYNWQQKTRIQFTRGEYLEVVAVLLGMGNNPTVKFDNHGPQGGAKKGFQLTHQGKSVFCSVFEQNKPPKAVPIPLMEALQIAHMMLSIYVENYPGMSTDSVMTSLSTAIRRRDAVNTQTQH